MSVDITDERLTAMLQRYTHIAVVGLSARSGKPSLMVAEYLQQHGYDIIPINPIYVGKTILDRPAYATLADAQAAGETIEIVDVFRRAELTPEIARQAVAVGAKALWLQLGIAHPEAARIAQEGGLEYVENRCIKIEHARLFS